MPILYFDPGTGTLLVQFFAAAVAGVALFYKTIKMKVQDMFGIKPKQSDDLPDDDMPQGETDTKE